MLTHAIEEKTSLKELQECIENAMSKVQAKNESKLCRYIPFEEGRLHHFAFNKLKKTNPSELQSMIQRHILDSEQPTMVPSKPRAALRVKRTADITLKRSDINELLAFLRKTEGADRLIEMLAPHQTLTQVQKLMIDMVRSKGIDQELWQPYVKLVQEEQAVIQ
jgi:hypothetical protein